LKTLTAALARAVRRAFESVPVVRSDADELPAVAQVPSPRRNVVESAVPLPSLAVATVPDVMSAAEWVCEANTRAPPEVARPVPTEMPTV
jgi:hypothetical protein